MSVLNNKANDFRSSIRHCSLALDIDPASVKALYLRSIALEKFSSFDDAIEDIKSAIKLKP